uniref:Lon proteolytic domain-containing protein n=1 Tax=Globodera pallida TaxID=36090 RepID=A0A183BU88_GLOPA
MAAYTNAYVYARQFVLARAPETTFFDNAHLEVRVYPNGVLRGGPSGGVTVATAIMSLAMNIITPANLAMSGLLNDQGDMLSIGGLIQKMLAAKDAGKTMIVIPEGNRGQFAMKISWQSPLLGPASFTFTGAELHRVRAHTREERQTAYNYE